MRDKAELLVLEWLTFRPNLRLSPLLTDVIINSLIIHSCWEKHEKIHTEPIHESRGKSSHMRKCSVVFWHDISYHSLPKTQRKLTRYNIIVVKMQQLCCRGRTVLKQKTTTKLSTGPLWQLIRKVLRFALLAVTPTNGQHQARKWEMRLWLAVATGRQLLEIKFRVDAIKRNF